MDWLRDRTWATLAGAAIGDALGGATEGWTPEQIQQRHGGRGQAEARRQPLQSHRPHGHDGRCRSVDAHGIPKGTPKALERD